MGLCIAAGAYVACYVRSARHGCLHAMPAKCGRHGPREPSLTGLALIVDDERFAPIKEEMAKRKRPPRRIGRATRPRWLFTSQKARKLRKKWWDSLTPEQQKKHQRKARASHRSQSELTMMLPIRKHRPLRQYRNAKPLSKEVLAQMISGTFAGGTARTSDRSLSPQIASESLLR
jgi:hypothetical protein